MDKNKKSMDAMQAKEQIRQYFGKHLKDANVIIVPDKQPHGLYMTFIEITYKNFKPIKEVRKDIEAMFTCPILTLNRYYTDKVLRKAVKHMKREFPDMDESMLSDDDFLCEVDAWLYDKEV